MNKVNSNVGQAGRHKFVKLATGPKDGIENEKSRGRKIQGSKSQNFHVFPISYKINISLFISLHSNKNKDKNLAEE